MKSPFPRPPPGTLISHKPQLLLPLASFRLDLEKVTPGWAQPIRPARARQAGPGGGASPAAAWNFPGGGVVQPLLPARARQLVPGDGGCWIGFLLPPARSRQLVDVGGRRGVARCFSPSARERLGDELQSAICWLSSHLQDKIQQTEPFVYRKAVKRPRYE